MNEVCTDNRFEVIAAYKKMLTERTNIETSHDEMAVIDNVLFRFWQMGWLPPVPHGKLIDADALLEIVREYIDEYDGLDENAMHNLKWCAMKEAEDVIIAAPTVIPADPAEEGE